MNEPLYTFTDSAGHVWDCRLSLASARQIKDTDFSEVTPLERVSLFAPSKELFQELLENSNLLFAVIFRVVEDQVQKNLGIDPVAERAKAELAFVKNIDGNVIETGREAFWQSLENFFPGQATALRSLKETVEKMKTRMTTRLAEMTPKAQAALEREIDLKMTQLETELTNALTTAGGESSDNSANSDGPITTPAA